MGRRSFPGGIITSTELAVTGYGASGMWTTQTAAQKKNSGLWPIPGITPSGPLVGPTIANVAVTDSNYTVLNDTPYIDSAGGYIKISGTGFASGAVVYVGGSAAVTTSFVSSTEVRAQVAAGATSNSFPVYVVNTDSSVAIKLAAVTYSGLPSWSTAAALSDQVIDSAFSIALSATGDSAITYSLAAGSTLPPGTALSSGGVFSGTVTGLSVDTAYSFSVVANDAENQDSSRTFTVNVSIGDQYFNLTPLLLNGEANVWIRDSSVNNLLPTINGDTRPLAFSPYNTNWSGFFDGTGDYLNLTGSANLAFGTSDFTIEFFAYFNSVTVEAVLYDGRASGVGSGAQPAIILNGTSTSKLSYYVSGAGRIISDAALTTGQWYHIVLSRVSSVTRMFINGVSQTQTWSDTTTYTNPANRPVIGAYADSLSSGYMNGYISNLRVLNGTGYTSVTIPTSRLTTTSQSASNCQLLTLQDNRFIDNSTNAFTITPNGDVSNRSFGPFVDTDITTGSAYFDGSGDYLSVANTSIMNFGTGAYTIEFWYWGDGTALAYQPVINGSGGLSIYVGYSSGVSIWNSGTPLINPTGVLVKNTWNFIQFVRTSNASNGLTLTINGTTYTGTDSANWGTQTFTIAYDSSPRYVTGYLADLRISDTARTIAIPTSNFVSDANTKFLILQYRRGENNHRFIDESGVRALTTRAGNASQGSFSPFSPAGWSGYFDGSTSYLNASIGTLSGTWTVEFWVNMPTLGVQYTFVNLNSGGAGGVNIWRNTSNQLVVDDGANAQTAFSTVTFATAAVWYHVAVTRDGTTTRGYINGVLAGTNTFTPAGVNAVTIGRYNNNPFYYLLGYISNLRIVDGVVVYTGAFTPPTTALTATQSAGTNIAAITAAQALLLTLQNNCFVDNSTTPKTLTRTGSLFIQAFSPFRPSASYTPATHGGSAYFDGSGDYVYITNNAVMTLGTKNHCIEFWMYPNGAQNQYTTVWYYSIGSASGATNTYYFSIGSDSGGSVILLGGPLSGTWAVTISLSSAEYTAVLNNWTHVVITRTGSAYRLFLNGILKGYTTYAGSIIAQGGSFSIGWDGANATSYYKGWISNFRVINGSIPTAYQTASTTTGTTIFTPPSSVPAFEANTAMVMNFTNGGIVNATGRNVMETSGTVRVSNVASKFGIGSINFGTRTDYLAIPATPIISTLGGDFTLEAWIYPTDISVSQTWGIIDARQSAGSANAWIWRLDSYSSGWLLNFYTGTNYSSTGRVQANVWTHVAVVRSGTTLTFYINGSASGTATVSGVITGTATTNPIFIGTKDTGSGATYGTVGYIDDLRITNGFARYTGASLTVPTGPFLTK